MQSIDTTNPLANGLRQFKEPAVAAPFLPGADAGAQTPDDFAGVFRAVLAGANHSQQRANRMAESFDAGQEQDLVGVMIAQQKARLSFHTTLQVRNKVVSAYQDIMNMPI